MARSSVPSPRALGHERGRRRYVVTGSAGFIGSHLVESLLARGDEVVGIDAFTDYYARELKELNASGPMGHPRFEFVAGELGGMPLEPVLSDADGVFHLAGRPGVRGSWGASFSAYAIENMLATQRLFQAAAAVGVRVVFTSSSSVYGNAETYPTPEDARPMPVSPYGVTKLGCEHLAAAYRSGQGLDVVSVRPFSVYGPRQRPDMAFVRVIAALFEGTPFHVHGTGEQSRDFTYVGDVVDAAIGAMEAGISGAVYNVGGGSEATLREAIALCEDIAGRALDVRYGPPAPGDVMRTAADTTRIRTDVGWRPRTSLREGLAAQIAWAESRIAAVPG